MELGARSLKSIPVNHFTTELSQALKDNMQSFREPTLAMVFNSLIINHTRMKIPTNSLFIWTQPHCGQCCNQNNRIKKNETNKKTERSKSKLIKTCKLIQLKWGQEERISPIFHSEDAKEEAVHSQQHYSPNDHCQLLRLCIRHAWNFQCQCDSCKGQYSIWMD